MKNVEQVKTICQLCCRYGEEGEEQEGDGEEVEEEEPIEEKEESIKE